MPHTLEHAHTPEAISERIAEPGTPSYLRDWVLGGIDGAVTTFAIVAGVAGAGLSAGVVIILGIANLIADGLSMAAGNFSGVKAENDEYDKLYATERRHIETTPEGERAEVREILAKKGFEGDDLTRAVETISADEKRWIEFMLVEEFGLTITRRSAMMSALATFVAFVICGAVPLVPYVFGTANSFAVACVAVGFVFFGIGALKACWSMTSWWLSGLETLAIGGIAAGAAYWIGDVLEGVVGI
ncbi:MAG: VIT1/CCC1 transporter family protein [Pseudomonadota bacterium]